LSAIKLKTLRGEHYHREKLVNVPGLFAMAIVLSMALFLLFPKKAVFTDPEYVSKPSALSIAYLNLLLKSDPSNAELRLSLVDQLRKTGQTDLALRTLSPLIDHAPAALAYRVADVHLSLIAQLYFAKKIPDRIQFKSSLNKAFSKTIKQAKGLSELKQVFEKSRQWADPEVQLHIVEKMIPLTPNRQQKVAWMIQASDLRLAQNNPKAAADWLAKAYNLSATYKKDPKLAYRLLSTLLATGKPNNALAKTPFFVKRYPENRNLLDLAISISKQAGRLDLAERWLMRAIQLVPTDVQYHQELLKLLLANGKLKAASKIADERLKLPRLSPKERVTIARLYEWTGQPVKAFKQWKWLLLHQKSPSQEVQQRAVKLAIGLDHYEDATRFYEKIERLHPLSLAEQKELIGLFIIQGQTQLAEASYLRYLKRKPNQREIWADLAGLQINLQEYTKAASTYEKMDKRFGLTTAEVLNLKNIYWLMDEPEKALAKLIQHNHPDKKHRDEYWKARMDLAWYLEDMEAASGVEKYIVGLNLKTPVAESMIEQLMTMYAVTKNEKKAELMALQGWARFHKKVFAMNALQYAAASQDWKQVNQLTQRMLMGEYASKVDNDPQFWLLRANAAREFKDWKQAKIDLQSAQGLAPKNLDIRASLIWLLIADYKENESTLRNALLENARLFGDKPFMWDVLAAGWSVLGQFDKAAYWYGLSLPKHQKDWAWLLDFAYALDQSGQKVRAWRVRRYILNLMETMPVKRAKNAPGRDWNTSYLSLVREFKGRDWGWKAARKLATYDLAQVPLSKTMQQNWLSLFTEWSLADGNESQSYLMEQQARLYHIHLPDWQRLGLALQRHESGVIEQLIESGRPLPLADKTLALAQNGYHAEALRFGLSHLNTTLPESEQNQLRAITVAIRTKQPNGIKIGINAEKLGDLSLIGPSSRYAHASDGGVTLLDMQSFKAIGKNSLVGAMPSVNRVQLTHLRFDREDTQTWQLGVDQRVNGSELQMGFSQSLSIFGGLSYDIAAGWHQRTQISAVGYALARWNHIQGTVNYQLDSRNSLNILTRWNQFDSVWGEPLGKGPNMDLSLTHTLFAQAPEWRVRGTLQWMQLSRSSVLPSHIKPYLTAAQPSMDSVLTSKFGRIGIGTTLQHGDPGHLVHREASPHWLLDMDAGYQWLSKRVDWGIAGGLGWRVLGDDELALTMGYASDNQRAGSSYQLWLGYNKYFGR
jgi:Tfp pilus assembly protein PilF